MTTCGRVSSSTCLLVEGNEFDFIHSMVVEVSLNQSEIIFLQGQEKIISIAEVTSSHLILLVLNSSVDSQNNKVLLFCLD